jgi:hypothetical protein
MGNTTSPAVVRTSPPNVAVGHPGAQSASTKESPAEPFISGNLNDPIVLLTLWLAIATTGLWIYTARLWRATVEVAKDAKVSAETQAGKMERSIEHAARAADAMNEANADARKTAQTQLRPYVYLTDCHIAPEPSSDPELDRAPLIFFFKNFGATPAKGATLQAQWSFRGHFNQPFDSDFSEATVVQLGDIPPDYIKDRDGYFVLGWEGMRWTIVFGQSDTLFVEGVVKYFDANGGEYETVFRWGATGDDYQNQKWSIPPHGNRAT